jgi:TonB family protein
MKARDVPTALSDNGQGFSRWLIQRAARSAPGSLTERLEEEWLADMATRRGAIARFRFALGCCWATRVIAHEYLAPSFAAAGSSSGGAAALGQRGSSPLSRRGGVLLLIAGAHALLIYCFATAFAHHFVPASQVTHGIVIDKIRPPVLPLQPSNPNLDGPTFKLRNEVLDVSYPPQDTDTTGRGLSVDLHSSETMDDPPKAVVRIVGGPSRDFPNAGDFYPSASRRLGEGGVATVRVCVNANGRLTAAPEIAVSSGSTRLDEGALKLARAGSGHYRTTTEDGRGVSDCYPFRVRFQLTE